MKKSEMLDRKLEANGLARAAYRIDGHVRDIYDEGLFDILDDYERREARPLARVAYEENSHYCDGLEAYVIYLDPERKDDWGMCMACALKDDRVSYQLVTQIRELMRLGYEIIWK